jgi:hypothetical protein
LSAGPGAGEQKYDNCLQLQRNIVLKFALCQAAIAASKRTGGHSGRRCAREQKKVSTCIPYLLMREFSIRRGKTAAPLPHLKTWAEIPRRKAGLREMRCESQNRTR